MARKIENLIGQERGYLKVLGYHGKRKKNHYWVCQCKCGKVLNLATGRITNDYMPSCGCYRRKKVAEMPRYNKTNLTDDTLVCLTRSEGEHLLERRLKLPFGQAKGIYNKWRKSYIYNEGKDITTIIDEHFKEREG